MAMSSGSETPSKRWYSRMTRSSGLTVSPARMARSLPSITRKSSVKPRRVRSSTAHATVRYPEAFMVIPGSGDPDGLDVDELADAVLRQLASVAGALDAAEGHARVGLDDAVDEDRPGLDLLGQMLGAPAVPRPQRGAESKGRVVGQPDGVVLVLRPDKRRDGPERLLIEGRHTLVHFREHGRRIESALAARDLAAEQALGPGLDGLFHLPVQEVAEIGPRLRADLGLARQRISHPTRAKLAHEQIHKLVGDRVDGDEPLGGYAALAAVDKPRVRRRLRRRAQV